MDEIESKTIENLVAVIAIERLLRGMSTSMSHLDYGMAGHEKTSLEASMLLAKKRMIKILEPYPPSA